MTIYNVLLTEQVESWVVVALVPHLVLVSSRVTNPGGVYPESDPTLEKNNRIRIWPSKKQLEEVKSI